MESTNAPSEGVMAVATIENGQSDTDIIGQLRSADKKFDRHAIEPVLAGYEAFMATGRYPYIVDVVNDIAKKHDVPDDLHNQLGHEVFLASGQFRLSQMVREECELAAQGFRPITELDLVDGSKVQLPGGVTYRVKTDSRGGLVLLAPGKRTRGLDLVALVSQHRAYEAAKVVGQLSLNNPRVRMARLIKA